MKRFSFPILWILLLVGLPTQSASAQEEPDRQEAYWQGELVIPNEGEPDESAARSIEFEFDYVFRPVDSFPEPKPEGNKGYSGMYVIRNGVETIDVFNFDLEADERLSLRFPHYDSEIVAQYTKPDSTELAGTYSGKYRKRRGPDNYAEMEFRGTLVERTESEDPAAFVGRWEVKFESSDDVAVGIFEKAENSNRVGGTFLTTTGDYRFLDGYVRDGQLVLCCFDGAHAFRFEAKPDESGNLTGEFWSANTWHETWTATRNDSAQLPDAFEETVINQAEGLNELEFPDLDGVLRKLNDPEFSGKARLIYVFGSWCPNCHDAANYFAELESRYGDKGLSILGLAFELTGDHERDANQVRIYLERHGVNYPVLVAGLADKARATEAFPVLDRVRSYPTTIFVDENGAVRGIHTGFTGPATGESFDELKQKFEALIEQMLEQ